MMLIFIGAKPKMTAGDCCLDIAEVLMKEQQYLPALRLLDPLINTDNLI